jgi:Flp pilus assembly pilin Flp
MTIDVKEVVEDFLRDETGLELSEYAIAAAIIAAGIIAAFTNLGSAGTPPVEMGAGEKS